MYNARDKALETKFKGYQNTCSQIHATFSDDTKYIISGSEDRKVYIWNVEPGDLDKKDKRPVEFFEAHSAMVTVALIAPVSTRQALGQSGDPLYDLCNPPPVTLVSRSDSIASSKKTGLLSNDLAPTSTTTSFNEALRPAPTNSWKEKCTHPDGNIIVTADYNGNIKIFRQDCAVVKRKQSEAWDTASTLSKKILRRSSINQAPPDRIKNWRQSITSINSIDTGSSIHSITSTAASRRQRSSSPAQTSAPSNGSMFSRNMGTLRNRVHSMQHINGGVPGEPSVGEHLDVAKEVARRTSAATIDARMARAAAGFEDEEEEDGLFSSDAESDEEAVRCRCGSTNFKAKHSRRGEHKLVCVK